MNAVISTDEAGDAKEPSRLRILRAGARFPSLGTMVVATFHTHPNPSTWNDRGHTQIQGRLSTRGSSAHYYTPSRGIQVNPSTLFVLP